MAWLIIASFAIALSELALQQKYIQPSRAAARVGADEVATVAWDDFYASADPVPDGPLFDPTAAGSACRSLQIENRRSVAADHTTYWQNREQFLAHVARKLAALANWSLFRKDDPLIAAAWRRRTRRVTGLAHARVAVACSYPLVLVTVGLLGGWLPLGEWAAARLADLSRLLPGSIGGALREPLEGRPIAYLLPPPILAAACTLWYLTVLVPLWLRWDQQEAALIFRRHQERRHAAARSLFYVGAAGPPTVLWLTMFIAGATVGEPSSPVTLLVFALMTGPLWLVPVGLLGVDWLRRDAPSADDGTGSD